MLQMTSKRGKRIGRLCFAIGVAFIAATAIVGLGCSKNRATPQSDSTGKATTAARGDAEILGKDLLEEGQLPPKYKVTERVRISTNFGEITLGLYGEDAPGTVKNFLDYVDSGFYENKIFHRVIPGFMVQTGGYEATLDPVETGESIRLEIIPGLPHEPGVVSMARTSDPHSATSQFFICVADAPQLNGGYAAFGRVEEGMDVVEKIAMVSTETVDAPLGAMNDVPKEPIVIEKIERISR